jgi:hypothetical protein
MPRQCLFCDRKADSKEHLWASWILEVRKKKKWGPIRHSVGGSPVKIIPNAELTVGTVCGTCNNGWMSDLETQNKPLIGCLLQDISTPLDSSHQSTLALWTLKTAMVLDSVDTRSRSLFYERSECEKLRLSSTIPEQTAIWIGQYIGSDLSLDGADLGLTIPEVPINLTGHVTTILVGHLAIQILSLHVLEHKNRKITVNPNPGQWDDLLLNIWPIGTRPVTWPPLLSFTNGGSRSIATLADRWRLGSKSA